MSYGIAGLLLCCALVVLAFDILIVRPCVARIEQVIATAAPAERNPPVAVRDMIHRGNEDRLVGLVAREVVRDAMQDGERMPTLHRVFTEAGVALLLPWHLSATQLETAYLATSYMGLDLRGFAAASERHLGTPLASVDMRQAAQLMAIAYAPSMMLDEPARMERRVQYLLSRPAWTGFGGTKERDR